MNFEELEKADTRELRQHSKRCFELGQLTNTDAGTRPSYLLEAQFYMSEIDRREANIERQEDRRIASRSHLMELIIIALIVGEIGIAFYEGHEQAKILERQAAILERVEKAAMRAGNMNMVRP